MPEDYQAILADLGVDTSTPPATDPASAAPATDNSQANNAAQPTQPAAPAADGANTPATPATPVANDNAAEDQRKQNEAFASMRSEISKYKKFIGQIMKGANYQGDEEGFMKALEDASYKRQAAAQGNQVSPELLRRMDTLENQNRSLIEAQNREIFMTNLRELQDSFKLSQADLKEFIELAAREQIDLTIPGTNFKTLYQGLFFEKLNKRLVEEARQEWIAQNNKANGATNPDGKSGKKDPAPNNVNTMAEFNSLLQSMPINNNK